MTGLRKLVGGDLLAGACATALLFAPFTKLWATYNIRIFSETDSKGAALLDRNVFPSILAWLVVLAALATLFLVIFRATTGAPADPSGAYLSLGGATFVILTFLLIVGPKELELEAIADQLTSMDLQGLEGQVDFSDSRGTMMFFGPLLAAGVAFGGFMLRSYDRPGSPDPIV